MSILVTEPPKDLMPDWDDTASDPRSILLLASMIVLLNPRVIVEAGTYKGHFALFVAQQLKINGLPGRIWTTDIGDLGVSARIAAAGFEDRITFTTKGYDHFLDTFPGQIDFAYIDASAHSTEDPSMRVRHVQRTFDFLAPGGIIAVDDTRAARGEWVGVEFLRQAARLHLTGARGLSFFQRSAG